jgi:hypothetical protein
MYLFSELRIIPLLLLFLLWGASGWLLTVRWFNVEEHERGFIGFSLGLVLANWLGNILVRILPMPLAFWIGGGLVLALGIFSAWPLERERFGTVRTFPGTLWILFAAAVLLFTLIGRGLGMLDDFQNLPTVSLMATGDIPPHFPGRPDAQYGYHYFLILLAVQFMRVAGAAPWTALDLARGLTLTLTIILAGLLAWRITRNKNVAVLSSAFFAFAGGTRWLLLLMPVSLLNRISASLNLIGSGSDTAGDLVKALSLPWEVAGSGPIPFPFAFTNGVNAAVIMSHNGYGVFALLIMLLLCLLANSQPTWKTGLVFVAMLASLAIANEVNFVLFYAGIMIVMIAWIMRNRSLRAPPALWLWIIVLIVGAVFALLQGGLITQILYSKLYPSASYFKVGFSLVAPAVISSQLGRLSLLSPLQLITALLELGPLVFVAPLVVQWGLQAFREEHWIQAGLAFSTIPSLLSVFIEYSGNAGLSATTRLLSNLFFMCKVLAVPLLWLWLKNHTEWIQKTVYTLGAAAMLGGVVLFSIELIAIPHPVYSYFITDMDARFYEEYWNALSPRTRWILDTDPSRALTLFGRQANSLIGWGAVRPEYDELLTNPDPYVLNSMGYSYIYGGKDYWNSHSAQLSVDCVKVLKKVDGARLKQGVYVPDFRQLANIDQCKK